jgi:hypothetical protein
VQQQEVIEQQQQPGQGDVQQQLQQPEQQQQQWQDQREQFRQLTSRVQQLSGQIKALTRVSFKPSNWLEQGCASNKYEVVTCFSVSKWVHLNWGDDGLMKLFHKFYRWVVLLLLLVMLVWCCGGRLWRCRVCGAVLCCAVRMVVLAGFRCMSLWQGSKWHIGCGIMPWTFVCVLNDCRCVLAIVCLL